MRKNWALCENPLFAIMIPNVVYISPLYDYLAIPSKLLKQEDMDMRKIPDDIERLMTCDEMKPQNHSQRSASLKKHTVILLSCNGSGNRGSMA